MFRTRFVAAVVAPLMIAGSALADVVTIALPDIVDVAATKGTAAYSSYSTAQFANYGAGGKYWGDVIGTNPSFDTLSGTVVRDNTANTLTFTFRTRFDGDDTISGVTTKYADLFIDLSGDESPSGNWDIGVALGYQSAAAGVYAIDARGDYKTSMDIWKTRTSFIYGGYVNFRNDQPGYNPNVAIEAPTVLLSGAGQATLLNNFQVTVQQNLVSAGLYDVVVQIQAMAGNLDMFNNFDVFWGTGDCSNDAIWGAVQTAEVPAPGAVLLIGLGLLGMGILRRRAAAAA